MHLRQWLQLVRGRTEELSRALDVSGSLVSQWARGKPVAAERCAAIEAATNGAVRRWDLRPDDWREIWPELAGAPGAPGAARAESVSGGAARFVERRRGDRRQAGPDPDPQGQQHSRPRSALTA